MNSHAALMLPPRALLSGDSNHTTATYNPPGLPAPLRIKVLPQPPKPCTAWRCPCSPPHLLTSSPPSSSSSSSVKLSHTLVTLLFPKHSRLPPASGPLHGCFPFQECSSQTPAWLPLPILQGPSLTTSLEGQVHSPAQIPLGQLENRLQSRPQPLRPHSQVDWECRENHRPHRQTKLESQLTDLGQAAQQSWASVFSDMKNEST